MNEQQLSLAPSPLGACVGRCVCPRIVCDRVLAFASRRLLSQLPSLPARSGAASLEVRHDLFALQNVGEVGLLLEIRGPSGVGRDSRLVCVDVILAVAALAHQLSRGVAQMHRNLGLRKCRHQTAGFLVRCGQRQGSIEQIYKQ
eukprot:GHVT01063828.1.p1 GENE.GHVT01063828.1~~GHVT01063828.1.p1  ORF type:complete len:144 (-),score=22.17 GHVT01063828.1:196-627(-)